MENSISGESNEENQQDDDDITAIASDGLIHDNTPTMSKGYLLITPEL